jgi:hypothetical protein
VSGDEWHPLEKLIGACRCERFMYMGVSKSVFHRDSWQQLCLYKHIDTRRYLNVAADGTCFRYSKGEYMPIATEAAIEYAFQ